MIKQKKNVGLNTYRYNDNPEELRFAQAWYEENDKLPVSFQASLLEWIVGDGTSPGEVSTRDTIIAATVIQWLGSPVGQCFLRDLGYEKKP